MLEGVDQDLLMRLALGEVCLVWDFGSRSTQWPDGTKGTYYLAATGGGISSTTTTYYLLPLVWKENAVLLARIS